MMKKVFLHTFCLLFLIALNASASEPKPDSGYNRGDAYWYFGLGIGLGIEIFDFFMAKDTEFHISPGDDLWGYAIAVRGGVIICAYLLIGAEYYLVSDGNSVFHTYGPGLTFFPSKDMGLYFKGSYNYGEFDYRCRYESCGKGGGHGFRLGAGYGLQVSESFTPDFEISYSGTFDEEGIYSSISFMVICSWY